MQRVTDRTSAPAHQRRCTAHALGRWELVWVVAEVLSHESVEVNVSTVAA